MRFSSIKDVQNYMRQTYCDDASTNSTYFQLLYINVTVEDLLIKKDIVVASVCKGQRNQQNTKYRSKIKGTKKHVIEKEKRKEMRKRNYENRKGTVQHEIKKEKKRETRKRI